MFKNHHYLRKDIHRSANCWVAVWNNQVVGFLATIAMPNGYVKNAWRGHRLVILPDFQGMGIGVRFMEEIANIHLKMGRRFYSRTAHPRLIYYMEHSSTWKPTTKHKKLRTDIHFNELYNNYYADNKRICGSFEFIGNKKEDI